MPLFSAVMMVNQAKEYCTKAQSNIDDALVISREMVFSVTPKQHGMECHAVTQMKNIQEGIVSMVEHWVEQYHQVGFKYNNTFRLIHSQKEVENA